MPIKPENRDKYPPDWKARRAAVLVRAGHRCEGCGVPDRVRGKRSTDGRFWSLEQLAGDQLPAGAHFADNAKTIRIVLTTAHLDHDLVDHELTNLACLCQRCHIRHDRFVNARQAALTRYALRHRYQLRLPLEGVPA